MNNYYITFGSADYYPYGMDDYVLVKADTEHEARMVYRKYHPDVYEGILNFSFMYNQQEWDDGTSKYYDGEPAEVLTLTTTKECLGE